MSYATLNPGRKTAFLLGLLAILALTGCGRSFFSADPAPPATSISQLPAATFTLPTTTVTPGFTPTSTPTPNPSPTPDPSPSPTATSIPPTEPSAGLNPVLKDSCLSEAGSACRIEHVVIISIDGLRPDALAQADTPTLDALQAAGAYSPAGRAVLPSVTLVNHASMLSGMTPEKHGVDWNEAIPSRGKVKGPTMFSAAHQAGLRTAMVVGKPKFEHLVLPDSVDDYIYAGFTDRQVVNRALEVIQAGLPDLLFIHLPDVDSAGHATGWMSAAQLLVVSQTDSLISEVIEALETDHALERTLLLVVSDHGGLETWHGGDSPEETTVPWLAVGPGVPAGVILETEIMMYDTAATALYALNLPIPKLWDGRPVLEIFAQLPSTIE